MESETARAIAALRAGEPIVIPTDTVYGLAADAASEVAVRRLYALKGRDRIQPTAVVFASIGQLVAALPELSDPDRAAIEALLPGPVTLVVGSHGGAFPWLRGGEGALGVRVPKLTPTVAEVVLAAGPVAATSANLPGQADPRALEDVPPALIGGVGAAIDGGSLPGTPSTVIDLTREPPVVLREGALDAAAVLRGISAARAAR